jgi:hypothetical protein
MPATTAFHLAGSETDSKSSTAPENFVIDSSNNLAVVLSVLGVCIAPSALQWQFFSLDTWRSGDGTWRSSSFPDQQANHYTMAK